MTDCDKLATAVSTTRPHEAAGLGFDLMIKRQKDLDSFIASEARKWPPIVKAVGLTLE